MVQTQSYPEVVVSVRTTKIARIESIDLLRGVVMVIMALDHVRDYFHYDAFFYSPTDLSQTSPFLFFTRFITHFCAPVFVFLAGTAAYLSGRKKSKRELSFFLLTRGIWLLFLEIFILSLFKTFNPTYKYINLQVIWAIGFSMIVLSGLIYLKRNFILVVGALLVFGHNLLDIVHVQGDGIGSFFWSFLHEQQPFDLGYFSVFVNYPVLPWIGIMALGYCCGILFTKSYDGKTRSIVLSWIGLSAILLFIFLRIGNLYGDPAHWSIQGNVLYSLFSFINVTKYPPSLQYTLITMGPALMLLSIAERPLNAIGQRVAVFGRVPMFYYLAHILFIHLFASIAGITTGHPEMVMLSTSVFKTPALQGYGFNLTVVYLVWMGLLLLLYPICNWYDLYKRANQAKQQWLSYL